MGFSAYELSIAGQGDYGRLCPSVGVALAFAFICSVIVRIIVVIVTISAVVVIVAVDLPGLVAFGLAVFARRSIGVIQDQFAASEYRFCGRLPAISQRSAIGLRIPIRTDSPYRVRFPIHFVIGTDVSPQSFINAHNIR